MEPVITTPTGAADGTPETETVTATIAAADAGDFSAFQEADQAARRGTPAPKVERPKLAAKDGRIVTGKDGAPAKGPKPADAAADERLTARVREAVDTSTADLRRKLEEATAELGRLKTPAEKKVDAAPKGPTAADEFKRIASLPNAPKAEEFDTTTEYTAALATFVTKTQGEERAARDRDVDVQHGREKASIERVQTFHGRITAYKEQDPAFATKLTPEVKALHGFARLQSDNMAREARGESPVPATVDHAIAEELYDSEAPAQMAVFLSEHPDQLQALRGCQSPRALEKLFTRLEMQVLGATAPASAGGEPDTTATIRAQADAALDRSVSKARPPAPDVGKAGTAQADPLKRALEKGDVGMFLELDRAGMAQRRGFGAR